MSWLNNAWTIGIGTGLLSGFLVTWITHRFLSKKENREYAQKVLGANREIIYAIRPGISEGQIPSREVIIALTNATARRFGISPSNLYRPHEIAEELIKEVMDSSFLSSAQKSEYCTQLTPLGVIAATPAGDHKPSGQGKAPVEEYREKTTQWISLMMGIFAALLTTVFAIKDFSSAIDSIQLRVHDLIYAVGLPIVAAVVALAFGTLLKTSDALQLITRTLFGLVRVKRSTRDKGDKDR